VYLENKAALNTSDSIQFDFGFDKIFESSVTVEEQAFLNKKGKRHLN
jgi:hypothetical protein